MGGPRTRQAELQQLVGDRGTVEAFVAIPTLERRAVGWYLSASSPRVGCNCFMCQAAREVRAAFIAAGSFVALEVLADYVREHPAPMQEATG